MILGQNNVAHRASVDKTKIYLPTPHIKVPLTKIFLKAIYTKRIRLFKEKYPHISEAKIKEGIFVGPQVEQLLSRPRVQK